MFVTKYNTAHTFLSVVCTFLTVAHTFLSAVYSGTYFSQHSTHFFLSVQQTFS